MERDSFTVTNTHTHAHTHTLEKRHQGTRAPGWRRGTDPSDGGGLDVLLEVLRPTAEEREAADRVADARVGAVPHDVRHEPVADLAAGAVARGRGDACAAGGAGGGVRLLRPASRGHRLIVSTAMVQLGRVRGSCVCVCVCVRE